MYFLFLFPFCNIENLVGEGRVKEDGGRWEQKKTGEFIKNKKKKENRRFCTTTNNLTNSRTGKMFFFFCQDTGKKSKDSPQSVPSSARSIPSAPLFPHGEACIVTVVGALF